MNKFATACKHGDIIDIYQLLDEHGEFEIENQDFKIIKASQLEFLKWFDEKLQETRVEKIDRQQSIKKCHVIQ
jgi:hypothetical protein